VNYQRLNQIRITDVKVDKDRVVVWGDAGAAYEPEISVKRFLRRFEFTPGTGFTVTDEVQLEKPAIVTSLLHSVGVFTRESVNRFVINGAGVRLLVEITEPQQLKTEVQPNALTAAGPPGSVDKGERQERGYKLLISNAEPVSASKFVMRLRVAE
jgi:hypothetical protein